MPTHTFTHVCEASQEQHSKGQLVFNTHKHITHMCEASQEQHSKGKLVFVKQRAADAGVQKVREMQGQAVQPLMAWGHKDLGSVHHASGTVYLTGKSLSRQAGQWQHSGRGERHSSSFI
eukprot:1158137-Pelagomonas_calceolata.AAC.5